VGGVSKGMVLIPGSSGAARGNAVKSLSNLCILLTSNLKLKCDKRIRKSFDVQFMTFHGDCRTPS
jgi:hypothetical protein